MAKNSIRNKSVKEKVKSKWNEMPSSTAEKLLEDVFDKFLLSLTIKISQCRTKTMLRVLIIFFNVWFDCE